MSAAPDDFSARVRQLESDSRSNAEGLASHERICAERYARINENITALREDNKQMREGHGQTNKYLIGIGLMVITGLAKLVFFP